MFLTRHAPTGANSGTQIIRGQADVPVDEKGKEIADARAQEFIGTPVRLIRSGHGQRTKVMAEAIHLYTAAPIEIDYRLDSWNLGNFQGKLVTPSLRAQIYQYMTDRERESVPGGESYIQFLSRLIPYIKESTDEDELVCVTHFHCIRAIGAWDAAGREGLMQDPSTLKRDAYFDQLLISEVDPYSMTPIIQGDMRTMPKAV